MNSFIIKKNILINPKIIRVSCRNTIYREGCLSFGYVDLKVIRSDYVKLKYFDIDNQIRFTEISNHLSKDACW